MIIRKNATAASNLSNFRTAVYFSLGFSCLLRFNELQALKFRDISEEADHLNLFVASSKTDKLRKGHFAVVAATGLPDCPVQAFKKYSNFFQTLGCLTEDSFVFQTLKFCKGNLVPTGKKLSYDCASKLVKMAVESIGLDPSKFGTHSLRAGAATSAIEKGVSERLLQLQGRWASSISKDAYVEDSLESRLAFSKSLFSEK